MGNKSNCATCAWEQDSGTVVDTSKSKYEWAKLVGVNEASVRRHLKHVDSVERVGSGESEEHKPDGSASYTRFSSKAWGLSDYRKFLKSKGQDPDKVTFTWGWTSNPNGGFWNKLNNVRPIADSGEPVDVESIIERIKGFTFVPEKKATAPESQIVVPTDLQVGKTDWNGGTDDTISQALHSFHRAAEIARRERPSEIVMVDAGDPIENIYSTSSQLGTNDRDLPHQVEVAAHILLSGIEILAPLAPRFRYAAVSSNHGAHRLGPKSPGGDVHADYGIVIANMIGRSLQLNKRAFGHVTVQTPKPFCESLSFETSGSTIGVVHGHQAGTADKLGEWWKGQSHGRMPTADARILIAGHFHSFRVQQSGDARWIMVGPASDRGSSWYTNAKGESSESGMLSFLTSNDQWRQLMIL